MIQPRGTVSFQRSFRSYVLGDIICITDFDSLNYLVKTSYVLGSELWENVFNSLLSIVKELFIKDVWESDIRR